MLIRDLKIQTFGQIALSIALLYGGISIWRKPLPDLNMRPLRQWKPTLAPEPATANLGGERIVFEQALARPVFRANRRPFDPSQTPAISQPAPPPPTQQTISVPQPLPDTSQFSLKGISFKGDKKRALVSNAEAPEGTWLTVGDMVSGWNIKAIHTNSILLNIGGQEVVLSLYVDNSAKSVGSP